MSWKARDGRPAFGRSGKDNKRYPAELREALVKRRQWAREPPDDARQEAAQFLQRSGAAMRQEDWMEDWVKDYSDERNKVYWELILDRIRKCAEMLGHHRPDNEYMFLRFDQQAQRDTLIREIRECAGELKAISDGVKTSADSAIGEA